MPVRIGGSGRPGAGEPCRAVRGAGDYDDRVMVTEIGFVSLLVAGLGALAGGLGYLAMRISRGRW